MDALWYPGARLGVPRCNVAVPWRRSVACRRPMNGRPAALARPRIPADSSNGDSQRCKTGIQASRGKSSSDQPCAYDPIGNFLASDGVAARQVLTRLTSTSSQQRRGGESYRIGQQRSMQLTNFKISNQNMPRPACLLLGIRQSGSVGEVQSAQLAFFCEAVVQFFF